MGLAAAQVRHEVTEAGGPAGLLARRVCSEEIYGW